MVSTYLVHHGYCATAEAFANSTGQVFEEDFNSIKNRQSKCYNKIIIRSKGQALNSQNMKLLKNTCNFSRFLKIRILERDEIEINYFT